MHLKALKELHRVIWPQPLLDSQEAPSRPHVPVPSSAAAVSKGALGTDALVLQQSDEVKVYQGAILPQPLALSSAHLSLPSSTAAGSVAQLSFVLTFVSGWC